MKSHARKCPSQTRFQAGLTLIELMIAITLGLLVLAGMVLVFANTSATRSEIDRTNRQIENGRYAVDLLRDDLQLAGFYGELNMRAFDSLVALPGAMPDLCATSLTERTDPAGGQQGVLRLAVQGVNDFDASLSTALDSCPAIKGVVKTGTDVILVRRAKTCAVGAAGCDTLADVNGKPVLQVSLCGSSPPPTVSNSTLTTHALAIYPDAGEFVHKINDCAAAPPGTNAILRPYVIYLYFVDKNDNVLKRAEFTGAGMDNVIPLVDGIENLQVDYGIDTNNDGNADSYTGDPASVANWSNVVTAQISLLARNTETSPAYNDTKTYYLGADLFAKMGGNVPAFNDAYRRHVYTTLVRIHSVSGRRETP